MNRSIPLALSLALMTSAAWAEDEAAKSTAQQDQAQSQSDAAGAASQDQASKDAASQDAASQNAAAQDSSATPGEQEAQAAAGKQGGQQDPTQMFIMDMYSHNLYEVQLGQLAQKQAQDEQVKRFAQMLIEDHTKANQQLKQLAQSAQVQVREQLDPVHQAKLQKKQQLPRTEFTRKFINDQVAGHMVAVLELTYQSKNAQNQQVKQFAQQMLPKMEQHLKHATQLAQTQAGGAGGEARQASERQPADQSQQQDQQQQDQQQQQQDQQQQSQTPDAAGQSGQDAGQQ